MNKVLTTLDDSFKSNLLQALGYTSISFIYSPTSTGVGEASIRKVGFKLPEKELCLLRELVSQVYLGI